MPMVIRGLILNTLYGCLLSVDAFIVIPLVYHILESILYLFIARAKSYLFDVCFCMTWLVFFATDTPCEILIHAVINNASLLT